MYWNERLFDTFAAPRIILTINMNMMYYVYDVGTHTHTIVCMHTYTCLYGHQGLYYAHNFNITLVPLFAVHDFKIYVSHEPYNHRIHAFIYELEPPAAARTMTSTSLIAIDH